MIGTILITLSVLVIFTSFFGMFILGIMMIGESLEDTTPLFDWLMFKSASLPFRPESLTIEGLRYRKWFFRFSYALIASLMIIACVIIADSV
jgi:hypothetical protein